MQSSRATDNGHEQQPTVSGAEELAAANAAAGEDAGSPPAARDNHAPEPIVSVEEQLRAELARVEDRYKRALADLENYRKRSAREIERRVAETREQTLRDWLEALDSVERALRMTPDDQGLQAVLAQMEAILARQNVTRLGAAGETFDPERHEAIGTSPADGVPERTIVEVARSGFSLGDRVLRPAQVVVSRRQEAEG